MDQRISIIGMGVADVAKSTAFYTNVFGWKPLPSSNDNITFFQLHGQLFSLYGADALAEDPSASPERFSFLREISMQ